MVVNLIAVFTAMETRSVTKWGRWDYVCASVWSTSSSFPFPQRLELMIVLFCNGETSRSDRGGTCMSFRVFIVAIAVKCKNKMYFRLQTADRFSYLRPFHIWLRVTTTLHPWSQAPDTPRGQLRWRSHRHTLSPTPRCREPPHGPRGISSCPQRDVAGSPGSQSLTAHSTAPMCKTMLPTDRRWTLKAAWCRLMDLDGNNRTNILLMDFFFTEFFKEILE